MSTQTDLDQTSSQRARQLMNSYLSELLHSTKATQYSSMQLGYRGLAALDTRTQRNNVKSNVISSFMSTRHCDWIVVNSFSRLICKHGVKSLSILVICYWQLLCELEWSNSSWSSWITSRSSLSDERVARSCSCWVCVYCHMFGWRSLFCVSDSRSCCVSRVLGAWVWRWIWSSFDLVKELSHPMPLGFCWPMDEWSLCISLPRSSFMLLLSE